MPIEHIKKQRDHLRKLGWRGVKNTRKNLPKTYGDCPGPGNPCPYISCRHHIYLDVNPKNGSITWNYPNMDPLSIPRPCSLDWASGDPMTLEEIGAALGGITRERVRQISDEAMVRLKKRLGLGKCTSLFDVSAEVDVESLLERGNQ